MSGIYYQVKINPPLIGFIFCATLFVYTFQRFIKLKTKQPFSPDRKSWMIENPKIVLSSLVITFISSFILIFYIKSIITIFLVISGLISVFYVGFYWIKNQKGLRDIPFIKVYLVATVWTMLITIIPFLQGEKETTVFDLLFTLSFFIYILAMAMLFDIKDITIDDNQKRTIPKMAGIRNTQMISLLLTAISCTLFISSNTTLLLPVIIQFIFSSMVIYFTPRWTKEFQYSLYIDGVLYLPALMASISIIF